MAVKSGKWHPLMMACIGHHNEMLVIRDCLIMSDVLLPHNAGAHH